MSDCGNVQKVFVPASEEEKAERKAATSVDISDRAAEKILFVNSEKDPSLYGLSICR